MTEWIECILSDIGEIVGGATPSTKDDSNYDGDIAWLTPKDLSTFTERYIKKGERSITEKGYKSCSTKILPANSVLFSSRAPIGYVAIAANEMCTNQGFKSIIPNEKVDYMFLYYLLKYKKSAIEGMGSGTTFKEVSGNVMKNIEVRIPKEKSVQKKIAEILDKIDSKIENNNMINRNLSEQLDALYDNWFGKYKPFNMGIGGDPNYELEKGWHIEDIYSIADIIYGAPFASKLFNTEGEGRPIVRIRDLKNQELCTFTPEEHPKGYLLQPGDIVVGMDGEFKPYIWGNEEAWLNQRVCVFNNKRANGKAYVYCTIKPLLYSVEATEVATTVIHIGKKDYDEFRIVLPPEGVLAEFEAISKPMFDQIVEGQLENRRLIALRDSLLPRLMSGELDVSDLDI